MHPAAIGVGQQHAVPHRQQARRRRRVGRRPRRVREVVEAHAVGAFELVELGRHRLQRGADPRPVDERRTGRRRAPTPVRSRPGSAAPATAAGRRRPGPWPSSSARRRRPVAARTTTGHRSGRGRTARTGASPTRPPAWARRRCARRATPRRRRWCAAATRTPAPRAAGHRRRRRDRPVRRNRRSLSRAARSVGCMASRNAVVVVEDHGVQRDPHQRRLDDGVRREGGVEVVRPEPADPVPQGDVRGGRLLGLQGDDPADRLDDVRAPPAQQLLAGEGGAVQLAGGQGHRPVIVAHDAPWPRRSGDEVVRVGELVRAPAVATVEVGVLVADVGTRPVARWRGDRAERWDVTAGDGRSKRRRAHLASGPPTGQDRGSIRGGNA